MDLRLVAPLVALAAFSGARLARTAANEQSKERAVAAPYAPSPASAPIVALGYRELAADVFFVRTLGYLGSGDTEAAAVASLAEAVAALDPMFRRNYDVGSIAMSAAKRGVDNSIHLRAIALLEQASAAFPTMWRYPNVEGQIYIVDLETTDPEQRRAWDERGALLLETAARKPNAPPDLALHAAILQTRYGRQQRAMDNLRELLLITDDPRSRKQLIDKLAQLSKEDAAEIAAELGSERRAFDREWKSTRDAVPATMYVLLGRPLGATFDLAALATGGHDVIGTQPFERLDLPTDPPADPPPTSATGPSSP